jgi:hypothetical protein
MNYIKKALSAFRDFLFLATRHWVSAIGVALASFAAISFLAILAVNISGEEQGNYQGSSAISSCRRSSAWAWCSFPSGCACWAEGEGRQAHRVPGARLQRSAPADHRPGGLCADAGQFFSVAAD